MRGQCCCHARIMASNSRQKQIIGGQCTANRVAEVPWLDVPGGPAVVARPVDKPRAPIHPPGQRPRSEWGGAEVQEEGKGAGWRAWRRL